jgi:hypothetical protein
MDDRLIAAIVAAKQPAPLVIVGETATKMAVFGALAGIPANEVAEFLLGRSAEQALDPKDSFGSDVAGLLDRPQDPDEWRDMVECVALTQVA